jgi:phage/plasmid-associated DNA primase
MSGNEGLFARARLDGKLVNVASDISAKIGDEGLAKTLISREGVPARCPYGKGFDMLNYARLFFAMNELPTQFFTDAAL